MHPCYNPGMTVNITIRNVPDLVRDELAERASRQGRSLQEYLWQQLERLAARPDPEVWLRRVRERKASSEVALPAAEILSMRDADRR